MTFHPDSHVNFYELLFEIWDILSSFPLPSRLKPFLGPFRHTRVLTTELLWPDALSSLELDHATQLECYFYDERPPWNHSDTKRLTADTGVCLPALQPHPCKTGAQPFQWLGNQIPASHCPQLGDPLHPRARPLLGGVPVLGYNDLVPALLIRIDEAFAVAPYVHHCSFCPVSPLTPHKYGPREHSYETPSKAGLHFRIPVPSSQNQKPHHRLVSSGSFLSYVGSMEVTTTVHL